MTALRNGPSGPSIKNDAGAALEFGEGATLRKFTTGMVSIPQIPVNETTEISTDMQSNAEDFRVTMPNCKEGMKYIARVEFQLTAQVGYDGNAEAIGVNLRILTPGTDAPQGTFINNAQGPGFMGPRPLTQIKTNHFVMESNPFEASLLAVWKPGDPLTVFATISQVDYNTLGLLQISSVGEIGTARISLREVF